jgi:hypothetical protein
VAHSEHGWLTPVDLRRGLACRPRGDASPGKMLKVPITIRLTDAGYEAEVTPSAYIPKTWKTDRPMRQQEVIDQLLELGFHLQDIVDAFQFADPDWMSRTP